MIHQWSLRCPSCDTKQPLSATRCGICGGALMVQLSSKPHSMKPHPFEKVKGLGPMWYASPPLPIINSASIVSLGEGGTPCIRAENIGARLGVDVWLKNEAANPTGSFKDRQVSVGLSHALDSCGVSNLSFKESKASTYLPRGNKNKQNKLQEFYVVSSGNVAGAAAAYCARAGAVCWVIAAAWTAPAKLAQAQLCGARILRIAGASAQRLFTVGNQLAAEFGWNSLSTAATANPFNIVGARTIAKELILQIPSPHWVIVPVGGGGLLGSLWQGFREAAMVEPQLVLPKLAGIQPTGCAPFVNAIQKGWTTAETLGHPWHEPRTIATGIADDVPFDAHIALPAIRESGGTAVAVEEDEIKDAQHSLATEEGLCVEPSAAVSVAGLKRLVITGHIRAGEIVCCLLTGGGLKDLAAINNEAELKVWPDNFEQLSGVVKEWRKSSR